MKILFINKYDITGGAGVAAFRLNRALEKNYNTDNLFLVGIKKSNYANIIPTRNPGFQNLAERGLNFIFNEIGMQYKFHPFSTKTIIKVTKSFSPDVISLHNAHGGYFQTSLLIELSKYAPIVWTLHDMWAFTANAAHTFGDNSWKEMKSGRDEKKLFPQIGVNTGDWLLREKKKIYSSSNITIVSPSKWLFDLACQSPVFEGKSIIQIPNGIDLDVFSQKDKISVRNTLEIPSNAKILIFSAEKVLSGNYKGGSDLITILKNLDSILNQKVHLIIVGESNINILYKFKNFVIHELGYIYNEEDMTKYLSAADVFIYPTKADNLPNALIEASACGVPSVTYDVGGCNEIVRDQYNGIVIPSGNNKMFVSAVKNLLENNELRNKYSLNTLKTVEERFSIVDMAKKYYKLFENLGKNA